MKSREEVLQTLRDLKTLPSLPEVAAKVLELSNDSEVSPKSISDTVEKDPAIATRLLKLVNSPYYGIRGTMTSVQQSVIFLGVSNLRNLVLSTSVLDLFDQEVRVGSFSIKELWVHSLATACAARELCKELRLADPEVAFSAGLIHDIGKIVMDQHMHEDFQRVVSLMDRHNASMLDAETAVLGVDHAEIGYFLASRWSLPEVLQETIGFHHAPARATNHKQIAALVGYADHVVRTLKLGNGGGESPALAADFSVVLPLEDGKLEEFTENIEESLREQVQSLEAL
ncbi:MAG: HDOD domain-containing protein [Calditrichaeota bacterium]|nr:HDOD domain-containing protein [Calditrichota bacterium]MCB9368810.1 HDOD domain-containing protein [Calditrichota bacterium]